MIPEEDEIEDEGDQAFASESPTRRRPKVDPEEDLELRVETVTEMQRKRSDEGLEVVSMGEDGESEYTYIEVDEEEEEKKSST